MTLSKSIGTHEYFHPRKVGMISLPKCKLDLSKIEVDGYVNKKITAHCPPKILRRPTQNITEKKCELNVVGIFRRVCCKS